MDGKKISSTTGMIPSQIVEALRKYAKRNGQIEILLLYGSIVNGNFQSHSDVDLAVCADRPLSTDALGDIMSDLSTLIDRRIDLIDLHKAEGLILYKIMTKNIQLKADSKLLLRFFSKALGYREDYKPHQDMMRDAKIKRFVNGSSIGTENDQSCRFQKYRIFHCHQAAI